MPPSMPQPNPQSSEPTPAGEELFRAVLEVAHLMGRSGAESLRSHGVTPPQYLILRLLAEDPQLQQQDIAARLYVTKGNISQIVATLEREGFVARSDGARHGLALTAKARQGLAALESVHGRHVEACFGLLGAEERRQLLDLLHRLRTGVLSLERERQHGSPPAEPYCLPNPPATPEPNPP